MVSPSPPSKPSTDGRIGRLEPLSFDAATVSAGFWAERRRLNRERTLPHGFEQLRRSGNLANLRLAAGSPGRYTTVGAQLGLDLPFLDSDVYKWLEAAGWELGRQDDAGLRRSADEAIAVIEAAQRADGYINSYVQVIATGREFQDLSWGHEPYCIGHLIQAGIAWHRALKDDRLLDVGIRAADQMAHALKSVAGPGIDGHPEIELALVDLARVTGEPRFRQLAAEMIELRGSGRLPAARFGSAYWQDHARVRAAPEVAGHAVRQMYLDAGAVDLALDTGDQELLDAVVRRFRDMVATRSYLTGGLGSRHRDEAFGDPYELPPDQAYAETCAAVASVMLAQRLLLATGEPEFADALERTIYNAVLPGSSLDGTTFFYTNPLQRRSERAAEVPDHSHRAAWFPCACCPPNLMRLLSSWAQYLATTDEGGIQVHQYATGEIATSIAGERVRLGIETAYPWDGRVTATVLESGPEPWTLTLRIPGWCESATVTDVGTDRPAVAEPGSWASPKRSWQVGDAVVLNLAMPARVTRANPLVDAIRGCVAIERGPLVYCLESADLPDGVSLEELTLPAAAVLSQVPLPEDLAVGVIGPSAMGLGLTLAGPDGRQVAATAIPYFAWDNRADGAMRVWIPVS